MQGGMFVVAVHSCGSENKEGGAGGVADVLVLECYGGQRDFIYLEVGLD